MARSGTASASVQRPRRTALLTPTRLKVARTCQRLHHFTYGLGYRPLEEPEVLRFGTQVHQALEAWWGVPRAATDTLAAAFRLQAALATTETLADPFERARVGALVHGYHRRWVAEQGRYEVLGVEARFETALRNPRTGQRSRTWRLAGRVDAVVRDLQDGRILLVEHKTASGELGAGSDYWRRLRVDAQVSLYFEGARALGHAVDACLYDVLRRPPQRPLKATPPELRRHTRSGALYAHQRTHDETPSEFAARLDAEFSRQPELFFARQQVVRLEHELKDSLQDVWELGKQLSESVRHARAPKNPDACFQYGRVCPFFGVCAGEASLEDPRLFTRPKPKDMASLEEGHPPKEEAA